MKLPRIGLIALVVAMTTGCMYVPLGALPRLTVQGSGESANGQAAIPAITVTPGGVEDADTETVK